MLSGIEIFKFFVSDHLKSGHQTTFFGYAYEEVSVIQRSDLFFSREMRFRSFSG